MNDLYEYSFRKKFSLFVFTCKTVQKTWRQIFPSGNFADMPKPRHYHSAVVYNNCMYVCIQLFYFQILFSFTDKGGGYNSGVGNLNDFHKFNFGIISG